MFENHLRAHDCACLNSKKIKRYYTKFQFCTILCQVLDTFRFIPRQIYNINLRFFEIVLKYKNFDGRMSNESTKQNYGE